MRHPIRLLLFAALLSSASPSGASENPVPLMTLEHAYDLAAASDQSLKIAFLEVRKADLLPLSALTRMGPNVSYQAAVDRVRSSGFSVVKKADGSDSYVSNSSYLTNSTNTLVLTQPLLDLSVFPARRQGKIAAESQRLGRQFTIREILFGVASAYFDVLKSERALQVNKQSLELAKEQESLAQKRADVGEVLRTDVLRAKVSVETARRTFITTENGLEFKRNTLRNILNLPPDTPLRLAEPLPYRTHVPEFGELLSKAYAQREDLRESALAIQQAEQRRAEIRSEYAPKIVASGSGAPSFSHTAGDSRSERLSWDARVAVQVPIFTGGQREIDMVTSRHDIEIATLQKERKLKQIEAEVKQAWLAVHTIEGSLAAVRAQVEAAEQSYKDLQNQYSAGTAKSVDVLSALQDLSAARLDQTSLTLDYQVALRNLEQVTGVFQEPRVKQACGK